MLTDSAILSRCMRPAGFEWAALLAAARSHALDDVEQLLIEAHLMPTAPHILAAGGARIFVEVFEVLHALGFRLFHSVVNSFGKNVSNSKGAWGYGIPACYELSFVRSRAIRHNVRGRGKGSYSLEARPRGGRAAELPQWTERFQRWLSG